MPRGVGRYMYVENLANSINSEKLALISYAAKEGEKRAAAASSPSAHVYI